MLSFNVTAHGTHKAGTATRLYEDAYAFDAARGRAAVADGASDAFEAGAWARLLVTTFVHAPPKIHPEAFLEWLKGPARAWHASLDWSALPWYAEQKARDVGGLATLLGFRLNGKTTANGAAAPTARWEALAVGDACLLQVRKDAVLARFPVGRAASFGSSPALLSTRLVHNQATLEDGALQHCQGTCQSGDLFLLATDAMAEWLYGLAELEDLLLSWETISDLIEEDFGALIDELRAQDIIRNDDTTLLVLRVEEEA